MYIWKLLPFFVHVIGWNGARWKWLKFFLYFLKLNLIFHSIRFRFIFVFRVIILLDEIFSSLFESSHFIIIKIVVDLFVFHHTKRGRWHVLRNIILSMIYTRASPVWCKSWAKKKALIPSFAGKALKVATDVCITICRGPDFHHRSILANFARKHRRLYG